VLRGLAEAERLSQKQQKDMEQKEYHRLFPAKSNLEAAVRALKEKVQKSRHAAATQPPRSRHAAARQAVDRTLNEVNEVIEAGDAAEIGDLHKQLQKQRETREVDL
jgi:hypothetical protein